MRPDEGVTAFTGSPAALGRAHGETFGPAIREYLADRMALATSGMWSSGVTLAPGEVLALVADTLPIHRRYAPDLYEETEALAAAAGISPAEAVLVGGFTDVVDMVRARAGGAAEDDCTAVLVPPARGGGRAWFAQTWDMHASAGRYVVLLRIEPDAGPAAVVFTTTGCLGQIGMNEHGIAVGITNLAAGRGVPGVTWPFVVRKALSQKSFEDALECVTSAPVAGGRNYLVLGPDGAGAAVESMPGRHVVERLDGAPIVRTNHCLDAANLAEQAPRPEVLQASSEERLARAVSLLADAEAVDADVLRALAVDPTICQQARPPYDMATVGAVVADPARAMLHVAPGSPASTPFRTFAVAPEGRR
jgi:isopenicillin-N N-acyltransferase-like protein